MPARRLANYIYDLTTAGMNRDQKAAFDAQLEQFVDVDDVLTTDEDDDMSGAPSWWRGEEEAAREAAAVAAHMARYQ